MSRLLPVKSDAKGWSGRMLTGGQVSAITQLSANPPVAIPDSLTSSNGLSGSGPTGLLFLTVAISAFRFNASH
ncbi:hypothetical protein QN400_10405 [Pseudomonas sp. RTC3]|uniref:hypothetical protein n=1 Tax=unclassified Pseudomonas TaxID=196821 RepID=UPI002AB50573|nr:MULTISPECIES: hypothetical protein [unclassified Pseudomonas]MEB0062437.1 hypothetical protein [Pseudomonas sp. RTC3]MDY7565768.1 hypothetical protein [Pseudomonas sp. 5C2]MEB0027615.1 hypothetical protein [Pseudomonas sp. MH9.2]MEB0240442.1 hypothetical protein [Pseudomonas sp. 5C2]WPX70328.1 hypothetical protein RHM55_07090 [Pseudomonas sp. MH9.2]